MTAMVEEAAVVYSPKADGAPLAVDRKQPSREVKKESLGNNCLLGKISLFRCVPAWRRRALLEDFLRVPAPTEELLALSRERAFSVLAPQLWNSVPKLLRCLLFRAALFSLLIWVIWYKWGH